MQGGSQDATKLLTISELARGTQGQLIQNDIGHLQESWAAGQLHEVN